MLLPTHYTEVINSGGMTRMTAIYRAKTSAHVHVAISIYHHGNNTSHV